jgi:hypothetical protein
MSDLSKITERMVKLITLESDPAAAPGEKANAMKAIEAIMAKHNLTREDVIRDEKEIDLSKVEYGRKEVWSTGRKFAEWESNLSSFVTRIITSVGNYINRDQVVFRKYGMAMVENGKPVKKQRVYFYGASQDVEEAVALYQELQMVIISMAQYRWGGYARGDGAGYCEGFLNGLYLALNESKKDLDDQTKYYLELSNETSLALVDGGKDWLSKNHGVRLSKTSRRAGSRKASNEARNEGLKDGKNYDYDKQKPRLN